MVFNVEILVFGSNLAGIHGRGCARYAYDKCGAEWRNGVGIQGDSYAIPTKDESLKILDLSVIEKHVIDFIAYAKMNGDKTFKVSAIGTGLALYKHGDIAPLFIGSPENCKFDIRWKYILGDKYKYFAFDY